MSEYLYNIVVDNGLVQVADFQSIASADVLAALGFTPAEPVAAVAHQWINSITTGGVPQLSQPAFSDISGTIAGGQVPTLNQSTSGQAGTVATIAGLVVQGANITITGTGTLGSPLSIAASGGGGSGANPTGSVGLAVVDGSATTFLRSDGAPALNVGIAPTWTGKHTFQTTAAAPFLIVNAVSGADGLQAWNDGTNTYLQSTSGGLYLRPPNGIGIRVVNNGSGSEIDFDASYVLIGGNNSNLDLCWNGTGAVINIDSGGFRVGAGFVFGFSSSTYGGAGANAVDTAFGRLAPGVVAPFGASGAKGWFQNSAGIARNTADVSLATTSQTSITDLTLNVIAGRKYIIRFRFKANNTTAASGLSVNFNGGTATWTYAEYSLQQIAGTPVTLGTTIAALFTTALTATAMGSTSDAVFEVTASAVCNAGGTLIPTYANQNGTGTLTIRQGASLLAEDSSN